MRIQNLLLILGVIAFTIISGAWVVGKNYTISGNLFGETIKGSGNIISVERDIPHSVTGIVKSSSFSVEISQGESAFLEVSADDNIMNHVVTDIKNNTLVLQMEEGYSYRNMNVSIKLVLPNCEDIVKSGSGDLIFNDFSFHKELNIVASGSGDIKISGESSELNIKKSGSGKLHMEKCVALSANLVSSGSGDIALYLSNELTGVKSGSHDIRLTGSPEMNLQKSGSGKIIRK